MSKYFRQYSILLILSITYFIANAQINTFEKMYSYNGVRMDAKASVQTMNGDIITMGNAYLPNSGSHIYVIKTTSKGDTLWSKLYYKGTVVYGLGIEGDNMQQTKDHGFIIAGHIPTSGAGHSDQFYLKIDLLGKVQWSNSCGAHSGGDSQYIFGWVANVPLAVEQTFDGGYISCGYQSLFDYDGNITKLDSMGNFQLMFRRQSSKTIVDVHQTPDSGFIAIGNQPGAAFIIDNVGAYLLKYNKLFRSQWIKEFFGGKGISFSNLKIINKGRNYIIAGQKVFNSYHNTKISLWKTDSTGQVLWEKDYEFGTQSRSTHVSATADKGFIVTGEIDYCNGYNKDILVFKTDSNGVLLWSSTFGGPFDESSCMGFETKDGGYFITGNSRGFDQKNKYSSNNIYNIKTDSLGRVFCNKFAFINLPKTICFGDTSKDLNGSKTCNDKKAYSWRLDDNLIDSTKIKNVLFPVGKHKLTLIASNGYCVDSISQNFVVDSYYSKQLSVKGNQLLCQKDSVELKCDTAKSYHWFNGSSVVTGNKNKLIVKSSGTYWVQMTSSLNCHYNTDTIRLTSGSDKPHLKEENGFIFSDILSNNNQWYCNGVQIAGENGIKIKPQKNGYYYLRAGEGTICQRNSDSIIVKLTISNINSLNNSINPSNLEIIPNPFHDLIHLKYYNEEAGEVNIMVYNYMSALVLQQKTSCMSGVNEIDFPTESLANGIYYINVLSHAGSAFVKSVKTSK